jgi:hypothetical protein
MTAAVELAAFVGAATATVDAALTAAAVAGRAERDLSAIVAHNTDTVGATEGVVADETHSVQPGTGA